MSQSDETALGWESPTTMAPYLDGEELRAWLAKNFTPEVRAFIGGLKPVKRTYRDDGKEKFSASAARKIAEKLGITDAHCITPNGFQAMGFGIFEAYIWLDAVIALHWLELFNIGNRLLRARSALRIGEDVYSAMYALTHQGIGIGIDEAGEPVLFDGQHRSIGIALAALLCAVYEQGEMPRIPIRVSINVPMASRAVIDLNLVRDQVTNTNGGMLSPLISEALGVAVKGPDSSAQEVSPTKLCLLIAKRPDVIETVQGLEKLLPDCSHASAFGKPGFLGSVIRAMCCSKGKPMRRIKDGVTALLEGQRMDGELVAAGKLFNLMTGDKVKKGMVNWKLYRHLATPLSALAAGENIARITEIDPANDPFKLVLAELAT